jgi:hypothetical protein
MEQIRSFIAIELPSEVKAELTSLEERLMDVLEDPHVCPHGNPFPGYEAVTSEWLPLSEIAPGKKVIIRRMHEFAEGNLDLLKFLDQFAWNTFCSLWVPLTRVMYSRVRVSMRKTSPSSTIREPESPPPIPGWPVLLLL